MMLVPTRVAPSRIHGNGLIAISCIPKGTPVWRFQPGFDQRFDARTFSELPENAQAHLRWFAYLSIEDGHWHLSGDHTCFMNHAEQPNTGAVGDSQGPVTTVALRDIAEGEELTCDYRAFDSEAAMKLRSP
jgi:SET domain-containing protein